MQSSQPEESLGAGLERQLDRFQGEGRLESTNIRCSTAGTVADDLPNTR